LWTPTRRQREAARISLGRFLESLRPDNLPEAATMIIEDGRGLFLGILNPVARALHGCSAYAGWLVNEREQWWTPGTSVPDGTFALLRSDAEQVEALADYAASRTIWIAKTDELFIASMSQRAIPWFTGSFQPNHEAIGWMLSSGSLGPGHSWDRRAHPLGPAACARLDRKTWSLTVETPPVTFNVEPLTDTEHRNRLREALNETCGRLDLDPSKWVFPLSGGGDCRAILLRTRHREGLKCITWGLREALTISGTDAFVARRVAEYLGLSHEYLETDLTEEPANRILERYLVAGEGRLDHIAGYLDGFSLWRSLSLRGVTAIVRGDQAFGRKPTSTADEARMWTSLVRWADYRNVPSFADLGLEHLGQQHLPSALEQRSGESAPDWRDRLAHAYRIPSVLAALNDLKSPYVEIANPLLVRRVVELTRTHPEHLRTDKRILRDLTAEVNIPVAFSRGRAIATPEDALTHPAMTEILVGEMSFALNSTTLSPDFASFLTQGLHEHSNRLRTSFRYATLKRALKNMLPKQLVTAFARPGAWRTLSTQRLALRAYLITRMMQRLQQDAHNAA
jgi:hypothetical protein